MAFCVGCTDSEDDLKYHVSRKSSAKFNLICGTQIPEGGICLCSICHGLFSISSFFKKIAQSSDQLLKQHEKKGISGLPTAFYRTHGDRKKILFYIEKLLENLPWRNYPANDIIVKEPEDALRILAELKVGKSRIGTQYELNENEGRNNIRTEEYASNIHSTTKIKKRRNTISDMNYFQPELKRSIHCKERYDLRSLSNSGDRGKSIFDELAEMKRIRPVVLLERLTEKDIGKHTKSKLDDAKWVPRRGRHISIVTRRMTISGMS